MKHIKGKSVIFCISSNVKITTNVTVRLITSLPLALRTFSRFPSCPLPLPLRTSLVLPFLPLASSFENIFRLSLPAPSFFLREHFSSSSPLPFLFLLEYFPSLPPPPLLVPGRTLSIISSAPPLLAPQCGTADAEVKDPSVENPELKGSPF